MTECLTRLDRQAYVTECNYKYLAIEAIN